MDGVHDLGGKQGFGPILRNDDDQPFHEEWETRAFGVVQSCAGDSGHTIDWFRYCRELIPPVDYLTRPYFDQWVSLAAAQLIDSGYITIEELRAGRASFPIQAELPPATEEEARSFVHNPKSYSVDMSVEPAFVVGNAVRAKLSGSPGHTRLPGYVRGRQGLIEAHHGGHVFPDASTRGEYRGEHLYTVRFRASDLWPEAEGSPDRVYVDLWELYLEHV